MISFTQMKMLLFVFLMLGTPSFGLEATFTPNPDDTTGPLPLSQKQRDQLTKLEEAIMSSPDPQATLTQIAQANNMNAADLAGMLERNRSDMGGGGASRRVSSWPQAVMQILATLTLIVKQLASKHPKSFGVIVSSLVLVLYIVWTAPRTGLVISTHSGVFSKGHTTFWSPPVAYINRILESDGFGKKSVSLQQQMEVLDQECDKLPMASSEVEWHQMPRKSKLSQAATLRLTLALESYLPKSMNYENGDDDDEDTLQSTMADLLFETASDILLSRRFTEFSQSTKIISSKDTRQRSAFLILPKAGDWNRYGLQPLRVAHQEESDSTVCVSYSTLKGGFFDGLLTVRIQQDEHGNIIMDLILAVPKKGRRISRQLATGLLESLSTSMVTSISTQVRRLQSGLAQSKHFAIHAKTRAKERQQGKLVKSIQMEEMAADRRRRRINPNVGRYRPSGQKMPTSTSPGRGPG